MRPYYIKLALLPCLLLGGAVAFAQDETDETDGEVLELSPFEVTTAEDSGYYASNSISGSRIDVRIQDMPLTIEVVTSEFIEDTGSTDLRESLRYSAGILLESQNDAYGGFTNPGGVNNPEGATGAQTDTGFKIRGFVTNNTLRKGFRRQHSTDTVNIDRVEVIRGPSALLYGVGNFGGVVNYLPKAPLQDFSADINVGIGSHNWRRVSLDVTDGIDLLSDNVPGEFGYRFTAAYEEADHWSEFRSSQHDFFSPVLEWKWEKTKIVVDIEVGSAEDYGTSFKSVRAPTLVGVPIFQSDRLETYGFLEFEGKDPRTFRWSGPDTFYFTDSWNANVELQQELIEDMFLLVGYNKSNVKFENRDIFGGIETYETPGDVPSAISDRVTPLLDTIQAIQIIDGSNSDFSIPVENTVLKYQWTGSESEIDWGQFRAELAYSKRLFQRSDFFASKHSVLAGYSWESQENTFVGRVQAPNPDDNDLFLYKNPTDSSVIRFDAPVDGSPPTTLIDDNLSGNTSENEGLYFVYSARLFDERLFLVGGLRSDTTSSVDGYFQPLRGRNTDRIFFDDSEVSKDTSQWGASFEFFDGITVYALQSEGIEPNFGGQRDGNGVAMDSVVAESKEIGLKFNLADGKFAATFSLFKIERSGLPFNYWWAPSPVRGNFERDADIIYRMQDWNLDGGGAANPYLLQASAEWEAAKASGAVFEAENEVDGATYLYLNASTAEGAAYLDGVFAALNAEFALPREQRTDNDPWPGWLYEGTNGADSNVNFSALDWTEGAFFQSISDESEGWEAQVIWTPTDSFQLVLNYSNVNRQVTDPGSFVSYPYAEGNWDRWATWYFPNSNWGLAGVDPNVAYPGNEPGLPSQDTADWAGIGWGKGASLDDTPQHAVSWWATWRFQERLEGLQLGLGGSWQSKREFASEFTSAGQKKQNETGTTIKAFTDPRLTINGMIKYSWQVKERDTFIQLNVDNLLDDRDQYGLLYAEGISWRLQAGMQF